MPLASGQLLNNRYWIRMMLGQGGMGAVYEGWDARLRLRCAVKENRIGDEASLRQFEREAILLAKLHHPNLPRVTDHFVIPGQGQYLVMDFVEGEDMKQRLARLGPLPEADVLRWADHLLSALAYLHKRGIIHRDIKPQNIKITPEGDAVLVDFGLAKDVATQGSLTITGAQGLTPGFAPPEQYKGGTDARTDLYAFGATLYNLLTGAAPPDALVRITEPEQFVPLARRVLRVSGPVAQAIDKALTIELKGRFASADEMRAALQLPTVERATTTPLIETEAPRPSIVSTEPAPANAPPVATTPPPTGAPPMFTVKSIPRPVPRPATQWGWVIGGIALLALAGLALGGLAGLGAFSSRTATPVASPRPATGPTLTPLPPSPTAPANAPPVATNTPAHPTATATRVVRTATPSETPLPTDTPLPETATALAAIPSPAIGGAGRLAFVALADGNLEIFTMKADGSDQVRLTRNKANDNFPAWSPDGKRIAFVSGRDGNNEIYVMNADGSKQTRLTNNPANDLAPVWSADGAHIAFMSNRDGDLAIYVMAADGAELFRLRVDLKLWEQPPDFAPDGVRIVFASGRDGNAEIYTSNQDGSGLTRLTNNPAADIGPVWSPDGKRIAFVSKRDGNNEIYVMNADGSGPTRLTRSPASDGSPSWSPDGARIAYVSIVSSSNAHVYVMNADGSGQTALTSGFQVAWGP